MKRFACRDVIPGCAHVFTGADDQSVLDQVMAHAAADHGLVKPPLALVELVVATTQNFTPSRPRGHLRLVGSEPADSDRRIDDGADLPPQPNHPSVISPIPTFPERVGTAIPFQRHGESRRTPPPNGVNRPAATGAGPRPAHDTYRHECVFYSGVDEFLTAIVPFVLDGLALDQPVMVAITEPRLTAVREALGSDAARVVLLDMAELGSNPASIIPAWRDFVASTNGRPVRGVGEPIWAGRRAVEIVEAQLHEALLNLAVDHDTPLWLMCPYDIATLDQAIIDEALRCHPYFGASADLGWSADLTGPEVDYTPHAQALFSAALPEPVEHPVTTTAGTGNISDVANQVLDAAAAAGLPTQRSAKLAAAVDEVASAGTRNSGAAVTVRLWRDRSALVCEVGDRGTVFDLLVGRRPALSTQSRERGIRLANELCDLVQVRSNSSGTTVRMHSWL